MIPLAKISKKYGRVQHIPKHHLHDQVELVRIITKYPNCPKYTINLL